MKIYCLIVFESDTSHRTKKVGFWSAEDRTRWVEQTLPQFGCVPFEVDLPSHPIAEAVGDASDLLKDYVSHKELSRHDLEFQVIQKLDKFYEENKPDVNPPR